MLKEAIKHIQDTSNTSFGIITEIGGITYHTIPNGHPQAVYFEPLVKALDVRTLTGLVDYLYTNIDDLESSELIVQVDTPTMASIMSKPSKMGRRRDIYLLATNLPLTIPFGQYIDPETFIVTLQSMFVPSPNVFDLMKLAGNIQDGTVVTRVDDGISQEVTAKVGITKVAQVSVPNPVMLAPYRTFLEVEQPASPFIFRMKSAAQQGKDGMPTCALFEADGGAWKNTAMLSIKKFLNDNLPGVAVIA